MSSRIFGTPAPNLWLGLPRTARYTIPNNALLPLGFVEPNTEIGARPRGRIRVLSAQLNNVTAGFAGFAALYPDNIWAAGQWDDAAAGNDFTDDTVDAQDADADDFALFTTTANDGFVIHSEVPFNVISIDQSTASAGGTPVFAYAYWGDPVSGLSGADAWTTITPTITASFTAAANERLIVLPIPLTAAGTQTVMRLTTATGPGEGVPADRYAVRIVATTAPTTTAGSAARIYVGRAVFYQSVAANSTLSANQGGNGGIIQDAVGFGAFFATSAANNALYVEYE